MCVQSARAGDRGGSSGGRLPGRIEAGESLERLAQDLRNTRRPPAALLDPHVLGGARRDPVGAAAYVVGESDPATSEVLDRRGDLDPITEDLLIGHLRDLEQFQWFVRAHLKDATGDVVHRTTYDKS